jgi:hypothetical protein
MLIDAWDPPAIDALESGVNFRRFATSENSPICSVEAGSHRRACIERSSCLINRRSHEVLLSEMAIRDKFAEAVIERLIGTNFDDIRSQLAYFGDGPPRHRK